MARQTVAVDVSVKLLVAEIAIPAWLRAMLIEQGWTPPAAIGIPAVPGLTAEMFAFGSPNDIIRATQAAD